MWSKSSTGEVDRPELIIWKKPKSNQGIYNDLSKQNFYPFGAVYYNIFLKFQDFFTPAENFSKKSVENIDPGSWIRNNSYLIWKYYHSNL